MEPQDFSKLIPNRECLYFPYTSSPLADNGSVYYAHPSILNGAVERRNMINGDMGMSFVECDSEGKAIAVGKTYIVTIDNITFESRVVRSEFNSKAIITISGLNGPNLIYEATYGGERRRWKDSTEDTSNAPWIFGIPTQDLTIEKIENGNSVTIEIYDPNGDEPRRFKVCFDWQKLKEFNDSSEFILKLDGISTKLLKLHSLRSQVSTLQVI